MCVVFYNIQNLNFRAAPESERTWFVLMYKSVTVKENNLIIFAFNSTHMQNIVNKLLFLYLYRFFSIAVNVFLTDRNPFSSLNVENENFFKGKIKKAIYTIIFPK